VSVDIADAPAVQAVFADELQHYRVSDNLRLWLDLQENQDGRPVLEAAQRELPNDRR
jgi:hypothetical protein